MKNNANTNQILLGDILKQRAIYESESFAYHFVKNGETIIDSMTYAQLYQLSIGLAEDISQYSNKGDRIALIFQPGLDFIVGFFACLYSSTIAVPCFPPGIRAEKNVFKRFQAIVSDAQPSIILTNAELEASILFALKNDMSSVKLLCLHRSQIKITTAKYPMHKYNKVALLQYTSGSTATPKGVMVSQGNLVSNLKVMQHAGEYNRNSRSTSWLPVQHDMGLIDGILQALFTGFPAYLMSPLSFLRSPLNWLRCISVFSITHSGAPNFAYELCIESISETEKSKLDLSKWRIAYNAAETVQADTLDKVSTHFSQCGFNPKSLLAVYGLAETTLFVCANRSGELTTKPFNSTKLEQNIAECDNRNLEGVHNLVSHGKPSCGIEVFILDPDTRMILSESQVGEICVFSESNTLGYWNCPQDTSDTFIKIYDKGCQKRILRTGDLGFLFQEELYITGRIKELIIIRGRKLYPQDLEYAITSISQLILPQGVAAFPIIRQTKESVGVLIEVNKIKFDCNIIETLEKIIFDCIETISVQFDLQLAAVSVLGKNTLPRTSSGKLQRNLCEERLSNFEYGVLATWQRGLKINFSQDLNAHRLLVNAS